MKNVLIGITLLMLAQTSFAEGIAQAVDGLETDVSSLENQVASLQTNNATLEAVINTQATLIADLTSVVDALVEQQRCHVRPADLTTNANGDYLGGVDWRGCDKSGLSMWGPRVGGTETELLTNADLRDVNFTLANLIGIYASGVNLDGARFVNASLAYSDFSGATISASTVFINTTCPDETNSDVNGGTCVGHMTPN